MTPRLKKLLVGFGISLIILVADRMSQSSGSSSGTAGTARKETKKRARTARINPERIRRVKEEAKRIAKSKNKKNTKRPQNPFKPISEEVLSLSDWGRNPFSSSDPVISDRSKRPIKSKNVPGQVMVSNVHSLKIESVATLGDKTFVIINGRRYQKGDNIDNMIIESIESKRIIFKSGARTIVKNVGS